MSQAIITAVFTAVAVSSVGAQAEDSTSGSVANVLLPGDIPMVVSFKGPAQAELFSKEIHESLKGTLSKNCQTTTDPAQAGFLSSSVDGRPWTGTMWARDASTYLRELIYYGYLGRASLLSDYLIRYVGKNADGYYAFPEYMKPGVTASGTELDGTAQIVIGMILLWQRLDAGDPARTRIYEFLHGQSSPLRFMTATLSKRPLIAGSGEFGGGCGIPGEFMNVVQNALVRYALLAGARLEHAAGNPADARSFEDAARQIGDNMLKYLVAEDKTWIWAISPDTMKPDPAIINHEINRGFGGLNGVMAMYPDAEGLEPMAIDWPGIEVSRNTFEKLANVPLRKEQYAKHGIWTQFDVFREGLNMSPSYGHGYALQVMLLAEKLSMAEHGIHYLADATYQLLPGYKLNRESPYWFFEQYYSPDYKKRPYDEACGALNIVNVAEPLKVARLIVGVDDSSSTETKIIPRVPPSWSGYVATNVPIHTAAGTVRATITFTRADSKPVVEIKRTAGPPIPRVAVRFQETSGFKWEYAANISEMKVGSKVISERTR